MNPGFETGDLTGWGMALNHAPPVIRTDESRLYFPKAAFLNVRSGTFAAGTNQYFGITYLLQTVPVQPNTTYAIGFWAGEDLDGINADESALQWGIPLNTLAFNFFDFKHIDESPAVGSTPADFKKYEVYYTSGPSQTSLDVSICFMGANSWDSAAQTPVSVDDTYVIEVPEPSTAALAMISGAAIFARRPPTART